MLQAAAEVPIEKARRILGYVKHTRTLCANSYTALTVLSIQDYL
jgi:hypothetical protein